MNKVSKPKYAIAIYEKSVVEEIEIFYTDIKFRKKLKELLRDVEEVDVSSLDKLKTIKLIRLVNKYLNYSDGDFWHLMYEFTGNKAELLNALEYQED
jgi:hypothetical protein